MFQRKGRKRDGKMGPIDQMNRKRERERGRKKIVSAELFSSHFSFVLITTFPFKHDFLGYFIIEFFLHSSLSFSLLLSLLSLSSFSLSIEEDSRIRERASLSFSPAHSPSFHPVMMWVLDLMVLMMNGREGEKERGRKRGGEERERERERKKKK